MARLVFEKSKTMFSEFVSQRFVALPPRSSIVCAFCSALQVSVEALSSYVDAKSHI